MISVILPTYNPDTNRLTKVIAALSEQSLGNNLWELIIIDNNSTNSFQSKLDVSACKNARVVTEPEQGLTYARLKGISTAKNDIIVMVDDDNILDKNYLTNVKNVFDAYPKAGGIGGKISPLFEGETNQLALNFKSLLAIRDLGQEIQIDSFKGTYPSFAPIGAGMAFKKKAIEHYVINNRANTNVISDRKGDSLSSSGDNEMILEILKSGWDVGYFPDLELKHIIPVGRTTRQYLSRLNCEIQESWTLFLLKHNLCPWKSIAPATLLPRKIKSWIAYQAWSNDINYIKWRGACGTFNGLSKFEKP